MADRRTQRLLDVAAGSWALLFIALGGFAAFQLWTLSQLTAGLTQATAALDQAGDGVSLLQRIPVVGPQVEHLASSIHGTAASMRADVARAERAIQIIAPVGGAAVALIGIAPLGMTYLPGRIRRFRTLHRVGKLMRQEEDPVLVQQLAWAALLGLGLQDLKGITRTPWHDVAEGRYHRLAAAQLRRLGIDVPPCWPKVDQSGE
ncbi:hypothetical protein [Saccharopolyspora elongata]|uniref:hypothetical protein n=1 Tax=Saccharopolyspora elongata TaxID=2530387 RepID=UPI001A9FC2F2|nr:hypothetical protein [Saccharopolyspora elongata]